MSEQMVTTSGQSEISRRTMLAATTTALGALAAGLVQPAMGDEIKSDIASIGQSLLVGKAVKAYIYLYPLAVFGVSTEVLTNVEKPMWETLSAPINQFMSVRESRPANHGVILPSTDTLYTLAWVDVTKEPIVFGAPEIPNIPGTDKKRFMMYQFMDAWTRVYYSAGLRKNQVSATNYIIVGPDFSGAIPDVPNGVIVQASTNQSWMIVRTQIEGANDLDNVHAIQDKYSLTPLSMFGKPYTAPNGIVDPSIALAPGPSVQANELDGERFFKKAAQWFNKVPVPDADIATGIERVLAAVGIKHGQPFNYEALSLGQKAAMAIAAKAVQDEFARISSNPASIGGTRNGWVVPNANVGMYGTDYKFRAAISFVGFGANLAADGYYPLLVQDSKGEVLHGRKKYKITFAKGQLPPAGAFWSVTMYQDHFLVPNSGNKFAVSSWMNPKMESDGTTTIYIQPESPGADKEVNWLPSSGGAGDVTPLMRLYWPLPEVLHNEWTPPPAIEVA
jgi:hypothetical protein